MDLRRRKAKEPGNRFGPCASGESLSIGKPRVIVHSNHGVLEEPFESLVVEVPPDKLGAVMELVGARRGRLVEMTSHDEYTYAVFSIPACGRARSEISWPIAM